MASHYTLVLRDTDKRIKTALQEQIMDRASRFYGGFCNQDGIVMAKHSVYRLMTMLSGLLNEDSHYYHSGEREERIAAGLAFVQKKQRASGLFDYEICNFDSPPDTAFIMKKILPSYEYLLKTEQCSEIKNALEAVLKKGAEGLMLGGFHTPNHRWAIASVLALCGRMWDRPEYLLEANKYLAEGIDINDDGEYAERSAGNYNRINNDSMLMLARAFNDDRFKACAVKNLEMMLSYIEPDGSIFSQNSTRYDREMQLYPRYYYWQYFCLGYQYQRDDFLTMASGIMDIIEAKKLMAPDILIHFMNHRDLLPIADAKAGALPRPSRFFEQSGVVRLNDDDRSVTILANHACFLHVRCGAIRLSVELAGSFFEHRGFVGESEERDGSGAFILKQTMQGWYYLAFEEKPSTSDWWKMPNHERPKREGPQLHVVVTILPSESGIELLLAASGVDDAPFRVEFTVAGAAGSSIKDGALEIFDEEKRITIGPAFHEHRLTGNSMAPCDTSRHCFTCYTPFNKKIDIHFQRNDAPRACESMSGVAE